MYVLNTVTTEEQFKELYNASAYTITGAGGDLSEWMKGINDGLQQRKIGSVSQFYTFKGADMNRVYNLKGDVSYQDDLTFLAFKLDGLNVGKLSMLKLEMGDRWFDDIVDNNRHFNELLLN